MNFTMKELEALKSLDVFYLIRPQAFSSSTNEAIPDNSSLTQDTGEPTAKKFKMETPEKSTDEHTEPDSEDEVDLADDTADTKQKEEPSVLAKFVSINRLENERSASLLQSTEFDGILICAKEHTLSITQRLLPHLAASAPFAIFCQYSEVSLLLLLPRRRP